MTSRNLKENIASFHFERQILSQTLWLRFSAGAATLLKRIQGRRFPLPNSEVRTDVRDTTAYMRSSARDGIKKLTDS